MGGSAKGESGRDAAGREAGEGKQGWEHGEDTSGKASLGQGLTMSIKEYVTKVMEGSVHAIKGTSIWGHAGR